VTSHAKPSAAQDLPDRCKACSVQELNSGVPVNRPSEGPVPNTKGFTCCCFRSKQGGGGGQEPWVGGGGGGGGGVFFFFFLFFFFFSPLFGGGGVGGGGGGGGGWGVVFGVGGGGGGGGGRWGRVGVGGGGMGVVVGRAADTRGHAQNPGRPTARPRLRVKRGTEAVVVLDEESPVRVAEIALRIAGSRLEIGDTALKSLRRRRTIAWGQSRARPANGRT